MKGAARALASGLGSGFAPWAPGTAGSAVAVLLGAALMHLSPWALPAGVILATFGGIWAIRAAGGDADPGWVVIDEVAGQWVALLALPRPALPGLIAAFMLFRLFDIAKPGPVGWADRHHTATGVMADDLIAGAMAAASLWAVRLRWPGLLG